MPVNPYDDRKVSLRRPHGNGDLDIVRASYTRRKANVTEALRIKCFMMCLFHHLSSCLACFSALCIFILFFHLLYTFVYSTRYTRDLVYVNVIKLTYIISKIVFKFYLLEISG